MKRLLNGLSIAMLFALLACGSNNGDQNGKENNSEVKVEDSLVTIASKDIAENHLDDVAGTVNVRVNHEVLADMIDKNFASALKISIIVTDDNKILKSISKSEIDINKKSINQDQVESILVTPLDHNQRHAGGLIKLSIKVNGVLQKSELNLHVNHRKVEKFEIPANEFFGHSYTARFLASSDDPNDQFDVTTKSNDGLIVSKGNICPVHGSNTCDVPYEIPAATEGVQYKDFHLQRTIADAVVGEEGVVRAFAPDAPIVTLQPDSADDTYVDLEHKTIPMTVKVSNTTSSVHVHIDVTAEAKPYVKAIEDMDLKAGESHFNVEVTASDREIADKLSDFSVAAEYSTFKTEAVVIKNKAIAEEGVDMLKDGAKIPSPLVLKIGANQFQFLIHRLDTGDASPYLVTAEGKKVEGVKIDVDGEHDLLTVTIPDTIDKTVNYQFYVLKADAATHVKVNGSVDQISVKIEQAPPPPPPTTKYKFTPGAKHVLANAKHAGDVFYIKIEKDSVALRSTVKGISENAKLVLKADTSLEACKGIKIQPMNEKTDLGAACSLSDDGTADCSCSLDASQKPKVLCAFAATMPSNVYAASGTKCTFSLEIVDGAEKTSADGRITVESVQGLPDVAIVADGDSPYFTNPEFIEMCAISKTDRVQNTCTLNSSWVVTKTPENLDKLFDDGILTNLSNNDFEFSGGKFLIKAYPRKTKENETVKLPRINLILAYKEVANLDSLWRDGTRCPSYAYTYEGVSNIGCSGVTALSPQGDLAINQGAIYVSAGHVYGNGDNNNDFYFGTAGWWNGTKSYNMKTHKVETVGDGTSKTVRFNLGN